MTKLTVRLTDEEMKLLEKLKEISHESTYNKTFIFALKKANKFFDLREEVLNTVTKLHAISGSSNFY